MIFRRLGLIHKNQRGFTLIEMAIAIAVVGIITGGIIMTTFGVISGNARSSNHMVAVRQVQNAGYWVSRDTQMAQTVAPADPDPDGFPLTLTWTDWETGDVHQVVYTLVSSELRRDYDGQETRIAEFIDSIEVVPRPFTGGNLMLTVTATVGAGSPQEASETRTYEIMPRPDL